MRPLLKPSAVSLFVATVVTPLAATMTASAAFAQVTVDLHALQALPDHPAPSRPARAAPRPVSPAASTPAPASPSPSPSPSAAAPGSAPATGPATAAKAASPPAATPDAPQPALPESVPDTASINPVAPAAPPAGAAPPPPPPVSDKAATTVEATTVGLRLIFAAEQSDLNPDSIKSIKELAAKAPPGDDTTFNVKAYSPGRPDDPSTARRISLSRAMSVRAALIADGVQSARIFVRALGEQYGDGPPNRVDVDVTGSGAAP